MEKRETTDHCLLNDYEMLSRSWSHSRFHKRHHTREEMHHSAIMNFGLWKSVAEWKRFQFQMSLNGVGTTSSFESSLKVACFPCSDSEKELFAEVDDDEYDSDDGGGDDGDVDDETDACRQDSGGLRPHFENYHRVCSLSLLV